MYKENVAPPCMKVEIWIDITCPWCDIGKRRFETALAQFEHANRVEVILRSYRLDPKAPRSYGLYLPELVVQRYGMSREDAKRTGTQLINLGAEQGQTYRIDIARPGSTFDAHRLTHLAAVSGLREEMSNRLMTAYLCEGADIGNLAVLQKLACQMGLPENETQAVLKSDTYADVVRAEEKRGTDLGLLGVPYLLINEELGVSGAQEPDVFLGALRKAWQLNFSK